MSIEVEVKARVGDLAAVEERLVARGAAFVKEVQHHDLYFNSPWRDFKASDEALRLRDASGEYWLTYKGPRIDQRSKSRHELEVPIRDPGALEELLMSMGYHPSGTVRKRRRTLVLGDVEACLDEVEGLGTFLELETTSRDLEGLDAAVDDLLGLLKELGIESTERRSYLELIEQWKDEK